MSTGLKGKPLKAWLFLLLVVSVFVSSAVLMKFIVVDNPNAFSVTYYNVSLYATMILFQKLKRTCTAEQSFQPLDSFTKDLKQEYNTYFYLISALTGLFWYFGNALYNFSLRFTSITSANSLSNSSLIFITVLEYFILKPKITLIKLVSLFLAILGLVMMHFYDASTENSTQSDAFTGNILAISGAFFYSCYSVAIKKASKRYKPFFNMADVFGGMGLAIFAICPFILGLFQVLDVESFVFPDFKNFSMIALNALVGGLGACFLLGYCITLLNPHIVQFGLTLTIPLSYLYDSLNGHIQLNYVYFIGSTLIFSSFGLIFYENSTKHKTAKAV